MVEGINGGKGIFVILSPIKVNFKKTIGKYVSAEDKRNGANNEQWFSIEGDFSLHWGIW